MVAQPLAVIKIQKTQSLWPSILQKMELQKRYLDNDRQTRLVRAKRFPFLLKRAKKIKQPPTFTAYLNIGC